MREIVVNARFLGRRLTGVERYGRELLHFLGERCRLEGPAHHLGGPGGHLWEQLILPTRLRSHSVLLSPANTGPLLVRRQVLILHDLSALDHPEWFRPSFAGWYRLFLPVLARRVARVIVPSEFVKRKVAARFSLSDEKIVTIPAGVDTSKFLPANVSHGMGRYVLFVGTLEPRKNLTGLLKAWHKVMARHPDVSLLIAGGVGRAFKKSPSGDAGERVHWEGYVPEQALPGLYAGADLFVLPSLEEGFGLTALEAMACGTPVLVSDAGALPELAGEAALVFSLSDPAGLAEALDAGLSSPALRASLRERGLDRAAQFSWQATAEAVWRTVNEV